MRLLHVVPTYLPATRYGGPIFAVHGLCRKLATRGNEVHVFTTPVNGAIDSDVPLGEPVDINGVQVWYFKVDRLRRLYWSTSMEKALKARIREFELAHIHSIYLRPGWACARAARNADIPYVLSPRGMLVTDLVERRSKWLKRAWISLIEKKNIKGAAGLHVTSTLEEDELRKFNLTLPNILIVPNGIDFDGEQSNIGTVSGNVSSLVNSQRFILYLGRVNWKKGLDRLIAAMRYVPDGFLVVAGNDDEGYQAKLESLARSQGVENRVAFIGPVYGASKNALMKNAELLVLPSYSENFGNVVLEAMAAGCPVVVTPEVGLANDVERSRAGIVVDGEPSLLGNAIAVLLQDNTKRMCMGRLGIMLVKEKYSLERVASNMEEAYRAIVQSRNTSNTSKH